MTPQEQAIIAQFIGKALQENNTSLIVDAFIGILQNDQATINGIRSQVTLYIQGLIDIGQQDLANLPVKKQNEEDNLNAQVTLLTNLQAKL